jgi:hypothetical protein
MGTSFIGARQRRNLVSAAAALCIALGLGGVVVAAPAARHELYVGTFLYFYSQSGLQTFGWPLPLTDPYQPPAFSTPCCIGPPLAIGPGGAFYATSGNRVDVFAPASATQIRSFSYNLPGFASLFFTALTIDGRGNAFAGYIAFKSGSTKPNRSGVLAFRPFAKGVTKPAAQFCDSTGSGSGVYGLTTTSTGSIACIDPKGRVRTYTDAASNPRQIRAFASPAEHAPYALADDPTSLELYVVNRRTARDPAQIEVFGESATGMPSPRRTIGLAGPEYTVYDATVVDDDLYLAACDLGLPVILSVRKGLGGVQTPTVVLATVHDWVCDPEELVPPVGVRLGPT